MSCLCGDYMCPSCGTAQGTDFELLSVMELLDKKFPFLAGIGDGNFEELAKFFLEVSDRQTSFGKKSFDFLANEIKKGYIEKPASADEAFEMIEMLLESDPDDVMLFGEQWKNRKIKF